MTTIKRKHVTESNLIEIAKSNDGGVCITLWKESGAEFIIRVLTKEEAEEVECALNKVLSEPVKRRTPKLFDQQMTNDKYKCRICYQSSCVCAGYQG